MVFLKSSIGRKYIMGSTGLLLFGFLLSHLAANLLVFAGPDAYNAYGYGLRQYPAFLWVARLGLIAIFLTHISVAISLRIENKKARPVSYSFNNTEQATLASRTMAQTGILMLAFALYHLAHYTLFITNPEFATLRDPQGRHDTYSMVVLAFQNPAIAISYLLAMLALGVHLFHGLPSIFQSLGLNARTVWPWIRKTGITLGLLLMLGFSSIPLAIWAGLIKLP
jgi:succinate dehydrogenase / fumarate reductase cytochrome b subunit